jgi:CheY-like chemotaxis protein
MQVELSFVFERAHGGRLADAERLLRWVVQIYRRTLVGCDVAYDGPRRVLFAFVRLHATGFGPLDRQRIQFWVSRSGGAVRDVSEFVAEEWRRMQDALSRCDVRAIGVDPGAAARSITSIATGAGLNADRRCYADDRPTLSVDIDGPGWEAVHWDDSDETLFIASPLSPPLGDPVPVLFRVKGLGRVAVEWARVVAVRRAEESTAGHPAGFALGLATATREIRRQIARSAPKSSYGSRAAPRFQCRRPLAATFASVEASEDATSSGMAVAGLVENISFGGAFVRTAAPAAAGAQLELTLRLPNGARIRTRAVVAFVDVRGMGLRFVLDPRSMSELHEGLTQLAARPRRALVVDDDALVRQMISDALVERGFEVVTAGSFLEGLRTLSEEILGLDLVLTDLKMPGRSGAELVDVLRRTGGEPDLVVGVMTGTVDAALASELHRAGADLVLGKDLGPEIIALKLDALLEERLSGKPRRASVPLRVGGSGRADDAQSLQ